MKSLFIAAGNTDCEACHYSAQRMGEEVRRKREVGREQAQVSGGVKPAELGSVGGISKAHDPKNSSAIEEAAKFDRKIVISKAWREEK